MDMDHQELEIALYHRLHELGLDRSDTELEHVQPRFHLDVSCRIICAPDAATVYTIIKEAQRLAGGGFAGIHYALLNLVAERKDLEEHKGSIMWNRSYRNPQEYRDYNKYISLHAWLFINGYDLRGIYEGY